MAELQRQFVDCVDPSNMADSLRIAPWTARVIRQPLTSFMMHAALERMRQQGREPYVFINLDDSLAIKDPATHCLEAVDWHFHHSHKGKKRDRIQKGMEYIECNVVVGDWAFTFAVQPYLRKCTVRRLNRQRPPDQRLHFVSKPRLARRILEECRALIPNADGSKRTFLVRSMIGRLHKVPFDVCVLVSRRSYRDPFPVYFGSTDLTLMPQQALQGYAKRWNCETDNWYLKQRLGLGDFRVLSYEAIDKFCAIVLLSYVYLQWRLIAANNDRKAQDCADVIRQHRDEHAQDWLRGACQ